MEHNHHFEGTLHQRSSSIKVILQIGGHLPSKVIFHQRLSSIKGGPPSKVVFHQRSSSINVVFPLRLSILKGRLPSVVFFHQRSSSIKGPPPSKVVFHQSYVQYMPISKPNGKQSAAGGHLPQEWIRHQTLRQPQRRRRPQKDGPKPSFWRNLPSKVVIHKGPLPKEVIFHQIRFNRLHNSVTICWLNHMPMLNACAEAHAFASLTQWKW